MAGSIGVIQIAPAMANTGSSNTANKNGYYQDANGKWHRPNGQFASNAEVGITSTTSTTSSGVHGNSLSSTKTNYGYVLIYDETGEVAKYGETLYPNTRYTDSFLKENEVSMQILAEGSKKDIHVWQHEQIVDFLAENGKLPDLNNSLW